MSLLLLSFEYALVILDDAAEIILLVNSRLDHYRFIIDIYLGWLLIRALIVIKFVLSVVKAACIA